MKTSIATILILASTFLTSFAGSDKGGSSAANEALSKVFQPIEEMPLSITKARETAKPGDVITIKGVVMGNTKPFVDGRAAFILGDPEKITPCNQNPDDQCKTPWDVCCETREAIKAATITVQVLNAEEKVLKSSIENINGLKPLSKVTVNGVVAASSNADLLILNARAIQAFE